MVHISERKVAKNGIKSLCGGEIGQKQRAEFPSFFVAFFSGKSLRITGLGSV